MILRVYWNGGDAKLMQYLRTVILHDDFIHQHSAAPGSAAWSKLRFEYGDLASGKRQHTFGNGIDAQAFVDFYASKGWMIGKNKMKDWKAAVRTWERDTRRVQQQRRNKHEVAAHPETQKQRDGADWMLKYMKGGE